jgi:hypothetical protein
MKVRNKPFYFQGAQALAANGVGQIPFDVPANFAYTCTGFSYFASLNTANAIARFGFNILDGGEGLFNTRLLNDFFPGFMTELSTAPDTRYQVGAAQPHRFPVPYTFAPKSNIVIDLLDLSGIANTVTFCLIGYKEFK